MISPMAVHLNPTLFEDPLEFNPWRWTVSDKLNYIGAKLSIIKFVAILMYTDKTKQSELLRNYMPFGGGIRLCLGAEFSKLFIALFIHVLVTEYRWKEIKGGDVLRLSEVIFPQGYHIQLIPHT
uniref:Cytochrome P450 n=1 Tax=Oryza glumipatula TaxID=40148 RepID=A0A0E0BHH8_9ORYZ